MGRSIFFIISEDCNTATSSDKHYFLDSCFCCRKRLGRKDDIFMYRGDTPFCSEECRQNQIEMAESVEMNQKRYLYSLLRKPRISSNNLTAKSLETKRKRRLSSLSRKQGVSSNTVTKEPEVCLGMFGSTG